MESSARQASAPPRGLRLPVLLLLTTGLTLSVLLAGGGTPLSKPDPAPPSKPAASPPGKDRRFVSGDVLVKFRAGTPQDEGGKARAALAATRLRRFASRAEHWRLGHGHTTEEAIDRLRRNPHVEYAEPDYLVRV